MKPYIRKNLNYRSTTKVLGVGHYTRKNNADRPKAKTYRFFVAYLGKRRRHFNADLLGRREAFRRALQARTEYEQSLS